MMLTGTAIEESDTFILGIPKIALAMSWAHQSLILSPKHMLWTFLFCPPNPKVEADTSNTS